MNRQESSQAPAPSPAAALSRRVFREPRIDVESVVSGLVLVSMLGFISMLFIACFDAGLVI